MGITKSTEWVAPLLEMRASFAKVNGCDMPYAFPRLDYNWTLVAEGRSSYSTARRKLAILTVGIGDTRGETYTLRSPKNLFPIAANQMSFDQKELAIIGHWPSTSRMPDRYDRGVCANELLLRNAIAQRLAAGWSLAPAYHIPTTVDGSVRIGKEAEQGLMCEIVVGAELNQAVDAPCAVVSVTTDASPGEGEFATE